MAVTGIRGVCLRGAASGVGESVLDGGHLALHRVDGCNGLRDAVDGGKGVGEVGHGGVALRGDGVTLVGDGIHLCHEVCQPLLDGSHLCGVEGKEATTLLQ